MIKLVKDPLVNVIKRCNKYSFCCFTTHSMLLPMTSCLFVLVSVWNNNDRHAQDFTDREEQDLIHHIFSLLADFTLLMYIIHLFNNLNNFNLINIRVLVRFSQGYHLPVSVSILKRKVFNKSCNKMCNFII